MLKENRHLGLKSYFNYAFVAHKKLNVKLELSQKFCQSQAGTQI